MIPASVECSFTTYLGLGFRVGKPIKIGWLSLPPTYDPPRGWENARSTSRCPPGKKQAETPISIAQMPEVLPPAFRLPRWPRSLGWTLRVGQKCHRTDGNCKPVAEVAPRKHPQIIDRTALVVHYFIALAGPSCGFFRHGLVLDTVTKSMEMEGVEMIWFQTVWDKTVFNTFLGAWVFPLYLSTGFFTGPNSWSASSKTKLFDMLELQKYGVRPPFLEAKHESKKQAKHQKPRPTIRSKNRGTQSSRRHLVPQVAHWDHHEALVALRKHCEDVGAVGILSEKNTR